MKLQRFHIFYRLVISQPIISTFDVLDLNNSEEKNRYRNISPQLIRDTKSVNFFSIIRLSLAKRFS